MTETTIVTVGADMFAESVEAQAVAVERVDWRPPMPGTEADLAAVATDPRRPEANRRAVEASLTGAGRELLATVDSYRQDEVRRMLARVDAEQRPPIVEALRTFVEALEP